MKSPRALHLAALGMPLLLVGCSLHNRVSVGPTLATQDKSLGGEAGAEGAMGLDGGLLFGVARIAGHAGSGRNGASLLLGGEIQQAGRPWGGRFTAGIGPALTGDGTGEVSPHVMVRGAFALEHAFDFHDIGDETTSKTVGVELFVNNIGFESAGTIAGFAVTFGWRTIQHPQKSIMASGDARRPLLADR